MRPCLPFRQRGLGFTLLEMLISIGVITVVTLGTVRAVSEARRVRSNARDKSEMAMIAQTQLERLRAGVPGSLVAGKRDVEDAAWPKGVRVSVETTLRPDNLWLADVHVRRESIEGKPTVRLTTILAGTP